MSETVFEVPEDRRQSLDLLRLVVDARNHALRAAGEELDHMAARFRKAQEEASKEVQGHLVRLAKGLGYEVEEGATLSPDFEAGIVTIKGPPPPPAPKVLPKKKVTRKRTTRKGGAK